jgi:hypothetical protein
VFFNSFTLGATHSVNGVSFETLGVVTGYHGALYTDNAGAPQSIIVQSISFSGPVTGSIFVPFTSTSLSSGTYWAAVQLNPGDSIQGDCGSGGVYDPNPMSFGFPNPTTSQAFPCLLDVYAHICP